MNDITRVSQLMTELPPERQLLKAGSKNVLDNKNITTLSFTAKALISSVQ